MTANNNFKDTIKSLHPSLKRIALLLNNALINIRRAYTKAEEHIDLIDQDVANGLYGQLDTCFKSVTTLLRDQDIKLRDLSL